MSATTVQRKLFLVYYYMIKFVASELRLSKKNKLVFY